MLFLFKCQVGFHIILVVEMFDLTKIKHMILGEGGGMGAQAMYVPAARYV